MIVFVDSHSATGTNFTDMNYTGRNHSGGKNWPLYLRDFNNMKLWNYAVGGSVIDNKVLSNPRDDKIDLLKQYELFYEKMSYGKIYFNVWNKNNSLFAFFLVLVI